MCVVGVEPATVEDVVGLVVVVVGDVVLVVDAVVVVDDSVVVVVGAGPDETVSVTTEPLSTCVPGSGFDDSTVSAG